MGLHSQIISPGKHCILLDKVEPRKILLIREIDTSLCGLFARRPLLHRRDDVGNRQPQVVAHEANPIAQRSVFSDKL